MKHTCGITPENITELKSNEIFVFGSNLYGIHGAGAAKLAYDKFGAKWGLGVGMFEYTYALPTKDENIETLSLRRISECVKDLKAHVLFSQYHFLITKVGCGLAGYTPEQIAPLFKDFLNITNCSLPIEFITILTNTKN